MHPPDLDALGVPPPVCPFGEHPAQDGMTLCRWHADRFAEDLRDLEDEFAALDPVKSMASTPGGGGGSLAFQRAPARLDVLVQTDRRRGTGRVLDVDHDPEGLDELASVFESLHRWASWVRKARRLTAPARSSVATERATLSAQLPWLLGQPAAAGCALEVHAVLAAVRRSNGTQEVSAGRCESLRPDATECGGTIWHHVIEHGKGVPDEPGFRCDRCRRVWTGTGALRLRDQLSRQGGPAA